MKTLPAFVIATSLFAACASAFSQVKVESAWARPTVAGQQVGGGYVTLTSASGDRLIGGSTSAAQRLELHTMSMNGDVMAMRQLDAIDLPAGKKVELKSGGLHLMFIGLKQPLVIGSKLAATLKFAKAGDVKVEFEVMARPAPEHKH